MLIAYLGARPESLWSESFCIHSFPLGEKKRLHKDKEVAASVFSSFNNTFISMLCFVYKEFLKQVLMRTKGIRQAEDESPYTVKTETAPPGGRRNTQLLGSRWRTWGEGVELDLGFVFVCFFGG